MRNLISTIQDTIREVFKENEYLSDIDLAYIFLLGVNRNTLRELKENLKANVKEDVRYLLKRGKQKDPMYKNRNLSDQLIQDLTLKTLELLDTKMIRAGQNMDYIDLELLEGYPLIEASQYDFAEVMIKQNEGKNVAISGKIISVAVRNSKKKKFAYLQLIDYKYHELTVLISSTFYSQYEQVLKNCKGKYVGLAGKISYDTYRKSLIIRAFELDIVKGYHVPRVPINSFFIIKN